MNVQIAEQQATNKFIEQTKTAIKDDSLNKRLGGIHGEYIKGNDKKGILIMGLNPAGDENTVITESRNSIYLNYIKDISLPGFTNYTYFKPIYDFANKLTNSNAKWDWCNISENKIKETISNDDKLKEHEKAILDFYNKEKGKHYTIYCGEMFYIHMTNQNELLTHINFDPAYIKFMLNLHLNDLKDKGVEIKVIYINNALLSHKIEEALGKKDETIIEYKYNDTTYKIALGSMLSGQRAMDIYSRQRLIKDITGTGIFSK